MDIENPFNALCELSGREQWCWKLYCTTCGTNYFRYGLFQLGQGKHPDDEGWIDPKDRSNEKQIGDIRSITQEIKQSVKLQEVISQANVLDLATNCRFPDFLGYLGVALFFTSDMEYQSRVLTNYWAPQLLKMVRPGSSAELLLKDRLTGSNGPLGWGDLETVEQDFIRLSLG